MARYVDGFVLPVRKKDIGAYRRMSKACSKVWKKYGALAYRECQGDDLAVKGMVQFPKMAKARSGETVFFSFIVYRSRADRDRIMAKVMKDPYLESMCKKPMPFDVKRMACGGFQEVVGF